MRTGALILVLTLVIVLFRQSLVELDYSLNKEYIKTVLCLERDIPTSTCNGKCHLKKELEKVEASSDTNTDNPVRVVVQEVHFILDARLISNKQSEREIKTSYGYTCTRPLNDGFYSIQIPPPELS